MAGISILEVNHWNWYFSKIKYLKYYCCTILETRNIDLSNEVLGSIVKWFAFPQINEISGPFYPTNPVTCWSMVIHYITVSFSVISSKMFSRMYSKIVEHNFLVPFLNLCKNLRSYTKCKSLLEGFFDVEGQEIGWTCSNQETANV